MFCCFSLDYPATPPVLFAGHLSRSSRCCRRDILAFFFFWAGFPSCCGRGVCRVFGASCSFLFAQDNAPSPHRPVCLRAQLGGGWHARCIKPCLFCYPSSVATLQVRAQIAAGDPCQWRGTWRAPVSALVGRSVTAAVVRGVGSTGRAEERCVTEPGSSSGKWEGGGKVLVPLRDAMPGGEGQHWRDGGAWCVGGCCHQAGKDNVNWSEIWSGGERWAD